MRGRRPSMPSRLFLLAALWAGARAASAQLIAIKTVPIAQGDQFQIFPSANLGMGSLSIALADSLLDPFINPALGARVRTPRFLSAPSVYGISDGAGGGRTLPLGAVGGRGPWFGGFALALQQIDPSRPPGSGNNVLTPVAALPVRRPGLPSPPTPQATAHGNQYAFAMVGRKLSEAGLALAASAQWAHLTGVDGVDLLYAGSAGLRQFGHALDLRVGALREWGNARSLQALALYNRFAMTHDVTYVDPVWDPATQTFITRPRTEHNRDETNTWGLQLGYAQPLGSAGWRIGWQLTANRMSHPKLPSYELANVPVIPWDPGRSSAYDMGVGVSTHEGPTTFGLEASYQPIWSYTWGDAPASVVTTGGDAIPAGGKTVENHFRFSNAALRMGVSQLVAVDSLGKSWELQLGLIVRSVHYHLAQVDHVQVASRELDQGWVEWTPTWGLSLRFPDLEIRYRGRVTKGTGRPGSGRPSGVFFASSDATFAGSILVAPSGPLTLHEVSTTTHQVSIAVPLP
jgi:hypothetical protein